MLLLGEWQITYLYNPDIKIIEFCSQKTMCMGREAKKQKAFH